MFKKIAELLYSYIKTDIHKAIEQEISLCYGVDKEIATFKQLHLSKSEKALLAKLCKDEEFISIVDKLIFGMSTSAVNAINTHAIAETRGGVKALQSLLDITRKQEIKPKTHPLTGKPID